MHIEQMEYMTKEKLRDRSKRRCRHLSHGAISSCGAAIKVANIKMDKWVQVRFTCIAHKESNEAWWRVRYEDVLPAQEATAGIAALRNSHLSIPEQETAIEALINILNHLEKQLEEKSNVHATTTQ